MRRCLEHHLSLINCIVIVCPLHASADIDSTGTLCVCVCVCVCACVCVCVCAALNQVIADRDRQSTLISELRAEKARCDAALCSAEEARCEAERHVSEADAALCE